MASNEGSADQPCILPISASLNPMSKGWLSLANELAPLFASWTHYYNTQRPPLPSPRWPVPLFVRGYVL